MFNKCSHKWKVTNKRYTPQNYSVESFKGASQDMALKILYGFTVIEQECSECGDLKFREVHGDQR